eukprot:8185479-Pyramimonas_sp.AAC.1
MISQSDAPQAPFGSRNRDLEATGVNALTEEVGSWVNDHGTQLTIKHHVDATCKGSALNASVRIDGAFEDAARRRPKR